MNANDTLFVNVTETQSCRACMLKSPKTTMIDLNEGNIGKIFNEITSLEVSFFFNYLLIDINDVPTYLITRLLSLMVFHSICAKFAMKCVPNSKNLKPNA